MSIYCLFKRVMIEQLYKGCSIGTYSCVSGIPIEMTALAITHIIYFTLDYSYLQEIAEANEEFKERLNVFAKYAQKNEIPILDFNLYYQDKPKS